VGFLATLQQSTGLATKAVGTPFPVILFPNPARTAATIQLPAMAGASTATLTLLDALGRTVGTHALALPAAGLRHELDFSGLAPGIYSLHVQAGSATAVRRLVVE
jgi:hypothetical protein